MATPQAKQVEWMTREDAMSQLDLGDRRLRDYIAAKRIRRQGGMLHAGDVATLQHEREEKAKGAKTRALATMRGGEAETSRTDARVDGARSLQLFEGLLEAMRALVPQPQPQPQKLLESGKKARPPKLEMPIHLKLVLTVREAAALGWPEERLRQAIADGTLPATKDGHTRIRRSDFDKFIADR